MGLFQRGPVQASDSAIFCPRDRTPLTKVATENVVIDRCDRCAGAWFDKKELRRVAQDKEVEALAARVRQVRMPSGFRCPRCGDECVQSFVGDVEVDTCVACHGVWLDRRELDEAKRQVQVNRVLSDAPLGFRLALGRL